MLKSSEMISIIKRDGEAVPNSLVDAILDSINENRFSYDEPEKFKQPRYRNLYWHCQRLFSIGTHDELIDVTDQYWPVARHYRERKEKRNVR